MITKDQTQKIAELAKKKKAAKKPRESRFTATAKVKWIDEKPTEAPRRAS